MLLFDSTLDHWAKISLLLTGISWRLVAENIHTSSMEKSITI